MGKNKLRDEIKEFIFQLALHKHQQPKIEWGRILALYTHAKIYHEYQLADANGEANEDEKKNAENFRAKIDFICAMYGLKVEFSGDPRGFTVRVFFDHGANNSFIGKEGGWGIRTDFPRHEYGELNSEGVR